MNVRLDNGLQVPERPKSEISGCCANDVLVTYVTLAYQIAPTRKRQILTNSCINRLIFHTHHPESFHRYYDVEWPSPMIPSEESKNDCYPCTCGVLFASLHDALFWFGAKRQWLVTSCDQARIYSREFRIFLLGFCLKM